MYLYLGKVQLAMQILKTLHPKLVPVAMFLHWKSQKELRGPEDSASAEDKVEFMVGFNMLLWQSKRFVTDKQACRILSVKILESED